MMRFCVTKLSTLHNLDHLFRSSWSRENLEFALSYELKTARFTHKEQEGRENNGISSQKFVFKRTLPIINV